VKKETSLSAAPRPLEFVPTVIVAVLGLALAVAAFSLLRLNIETVERQRFQRDATYWSTAFTGAVERHVNSLAALRAFVSASHHVSRWDFSTFAKETLPGNPGFPAFYWVPVVTGEDRPRYEAQLERDGLYGLTIRQIAADGALFPAAQKPLYRPLSYAEPFEENHQAVALDLSDLPVFRELFETAEKTGQVAVSPPIERSVLDNEPGPAVIVAFPFLAPKDGKPQGYTLGVLKFERILSSIASSNALVEIAIAYNEPAFARKVIYSSVGNPAESRGIAEWARKSAFSQIVPFTVAGQHFTLGLRAPPPASPLNTLAEPLGVAFLILALATLLARHLFTTQMAKREVERAVVLRTAQLQRANAALEDEIQQRRVTEANLRTANEKTEIANRTKSEFLATMSHELRTPLNTIIGFSSMLTGGTVTSLQARQYEDYAHQIHEGGIRLLSLINDLLELSQMDSGRIQLDEDLVHIPGMIDTVLWKMEKKASAGGVRLYADLPDTLPRLRADERRLQKALVHLLSNAVKFTPQGGEARIAVSCPSDGTLRVAVKDSGVGIPKGEEQHIFEPFVQLDSTLARNHEGAGLGLTLVGRLAEVHGASLSVASELGNGTCITLTFPASRVVKDAEVA
jgi:signal transduction histidine kinase